jgi:hypothetical protein
MGLGQALHYFSFALKKLLSRPLIRLLKFLNFLGMQAFDNCHLPLMLRNKTLLLVLDFCLVLVFELLDFLFEAQLHIVELVGGVFRAVFHGLLEFLVAVLPLPNLSIFLLSGDELVLSEVFLYFSPFELEIADPYFVLFEFFF